jgi:hypothetical protein
MRIKADIGESKQGSASRSRPTFLDGERTWLPDTIPPI